MQAGWQVSFKPLTPDLAKLNPLAGLQRIFSLKGLVRALVALAKFALLGLTLWFNVGDRLPLLFDLQNMPVEVAVPVVADLALDILWWIAVPLLLIGIIDLLYQRWDHTRSLRMSKQEVKDESKNEEGDPEIRARIRRAQRELATRRMMDEVPKADVVVTNPTHYSVALRYERGAMAAPRVVAKGVDEVALRIREVAREHEVPIWEEPPLARSLYAACDLDDEIPAELYQAVATVLAQVLRLKERAANA
ncbi:MAG: flagellar type III secretion system protein FlhB [Planctomycetota bacterium]